MDTTKEIGTEQDAKRAVAMEIALKVGLLEKCEEHGCVYDAMNDFALEDAFRFADALMSQNDPSVDVFVGNRKRMRHAIENIRAGMPNCCPECFYAKQNQQ
ncbi:MAG: hypothetical protein JW959_05800 [Pirellulales bacterium]|nr:hypothetical protein [Pirellulales bacterium]